MWNQERNVRGQGQGPTFRGHTHSGPMTEMVQAKAKNQGHSFSKNCGRLIF